MTIHQQFPRGAYAPEKLKAINSAYRSALDVLQLCPSLKNGMDDQTARVELAKTMMRLAAEGDVDESCLREKALFHLALMSDPAS
jgi:uncharacterized tellurite resistance protein B-like protein